MARFKVPPLPLTVISPLATETSVPAGIFIGSFPVLDIMLLVVNVVELPDLKQRFAADLLLASFFVGLDAFGSREDERAVAVADRGDLVDRTVHAATRLRDAARAVDDRFACFVVFENDVEGLADLLALLLDAGDVASLAELFC